MDPHALFVPGWGAPATLYEPGLPAGWRALDPPSFGGSLTDYRRWLGLELHRFGRSPLGGHSMGGALAILAAADSPELVERLVLVSPAGLPLEKPIWASVLEFVRQTARGLYPRDVAAKAAGAVARAPRAALALAQEVRGLDLRAECARVRDAGIPTHVVGCSSDTLVTCDRARALASALGAEYSELALAGGHMWMLDGGSTFSGVLSAP
jgi:pimeloyl-ACP methyl ester carboxylesterase